MDFSAICLRSDHFRIFLYISLIAYISAIPVKIHVKKNQRFYQLSQDKDLYICLGTDSEKGRRYLIRNIRCIFLLDCSNFHPKICWDVLFMKTIIYGIAKNNREVTNKCCLGLFFSALFIGINES